MEGCHDGMLVRQHHEMNVILPRKADGRIKYYLQGRQVPGRPKRFSVMCPSPNVSRTHCQVIAKEDGYWIKDCESANGTFLNDDRIIPGHETQLRFGDMIGLGVSHQEKSRRIDVRKSCFYIFAFKQRDDTIGALIPSDDSFLTELIFGTNPVNPGRNKNNTEEKEIPSSSRSSVETLNLVEDEPKDQEDGNEPHALGNISRESDDFTEESYQYFERESRRRRGLPPQFQKQNAKPNPVKLDIAKITKRTSKLTLDPRKEETPEPSKLIKDFASLFQNQNPEETYSDCRIIVTKDVDGEDWIVKKNENEMKLYAHKCILSVRSPKFKSLFPRCKKDCGIEIIEEKEISFGAMNIMLHFLYSNEVLPFTIDPKEGEDGVCVSEILKAAEKYEVQDLLNYFDGILGERDWCKEKNAVFLLKLANKFKLKKAQKKIQDFVTRRRRLTQTVIENF